MKKAFIILYVLSLCSGLIQAKGVAPVGLDSVHLLRHGDFMVLDMMVDLQPTEVSSYKAQILTPLIVSDSGDTVAMKPIGVYGRQRYIVHERNSKYPLGAADEDIFKTSNRPSNLAYNAMVPFDEWMNTSRLVMRRSLYGCVDCLMDEKIDTIANYFQPDPEIPEIIYFPTHETGAKVDTLEGSAFVDFPVDKIVIYPEYRNNVRELGRIQATIDTVLNDPDVTITGVWLKGFASPESPYSHNTYLAKGRTAALKKHISQLYKFEDNMVDTDYEPEDWEGLRRFVVNSNIDNKEGILELIDSSLAPDAKEAAIKKKYPTEYKFMLDNFYPALRHTDYRITYEIMRFDDLDKIRQVMRTKPNRLSLEEFFLLGNACPPGSDEFNDVYETAARIYPDNPTANINAANAALQRLDYANAERYLSQAGNSPEAIYARGSLAFLRGNLDLAESLMTQIEYMDEAKDVLREIARIRAHEAVMSGPTKIILE